MASVTTTGLQEAGTPASAIVQVQWAIAAGTADVITGVFSPAITALTDGLIVGVRASTRNATPTPTFAPNGLTAHTISRSGNQALKPGDIYAAGHELLLRYNLTNLKWELLNPNNRLILNEKTTNFSTSGNWTRQDSGTVWQMTGDASVVSLPATQIGLTLTYRNFGASDGAVGFSISPVSADKIMGISYAGVDNKDFINTKATAKVGDEITLFGDGVDGWIIQKMIGIWDIEA